MSASTNDKSKSIIQTVFCYACTIFAIVSSGDVMYLNSNVKFVYVSQIILSVLLLFGYLSKNTKRCDSFVVALVGSVLIVLSMIFNNDYHGYSIIVSLFVAALYAMVFDVKRFFLAYSNIICFLAVYDLLLFLLVNCSPVIFNFFPQWPLDDRYSFAGLSFFHGTSTDLLSYRSYSIFREPAMYCIYLGVALLSEIFISHKHSYLKLVLFSLAFLTTKSMTGLIVWFFLFAVWICINRANKKILLTLSIVILVMSYLGYIYGKFAYIVSRLDINGPSRHSIVSRLYSIIVGIQVGMTSPLVGRGAVKSQELFYKYADVLSLDVGVCWANMITYLFASFGVFFLTFFIVGIGGVGLYSKNKLLACITILVAILLLLCGEILGYTLVIYIVIMYGWQLIIGRCRNGAQA